MAATFLQSFISYLHVDTLLKAQFRMGAEKNPWMDRVPEGDLTAILPLIVIEGYREEREYTTEKAFVAKVTFDLAVYVEGLANAEAHGGYVFAAVAPLLDGPQELKMDPPLRLSGLWLPSLSIGREEVRRASGDWVYHVRHQVEAKYRSTYLGALA